MMLLEIYTHIIYIYIYHNGYLLALLERIFRVESVGFRYFALPYSPWLFAFDESVLQTKRGMSVYMYREMMHPGTTGMYTYIRIYSLYPYCALPTTTIQCYINLKFDIYVEKERQKQSLDFVCSVMCAAAALYHNYIEGPQT